MRNADALIKGSPRTREARKLALSLLNSALTTIDPYQLVCRVMQIQKHYLVFKNQKIRLQDIPGIYVVGAGKATGRMAEAIEAILIDHITTGLIIVPDATLKDYTLDRIIIRSGGHPLPTTEAVAATKELLQLLAQAPPETLVICLISGGGSALLSLPASPITVDDMQKTNMLLVRSGLAIKEINTVRKHLSRIKGGQLARHIHPHNLWTLAISDVPEDRLDVIASGPTVPDPTTFEDAVMILQRQKLWNQLPQHVRQHLKKGLTGRILDTPKPGDPIFNSVITRIIGSNRNACEAIQKAAEGEGIPAQILTTNCQGEAREVGLHIGKLALQLQDKTTRMPEIFIVGSETTVTVQHPGRGGRNSELTTAAIPVIHGHDGLVIASLATDGIDGSTEYAGAIIDGTSYARAQQLHLSPTNALAQNSTYELIEALGDQIITGPTHTNVRDITIILAIPSSKTPQA